MMKLDPYEGCSLKPQTRLLRPHSCQCSPAQMHSQGLALAFCRRYTANP